MPNLGLGTSLSSSGLVTPGVVTDGLVLKHMYPAGAVQPVSDGAAFFKDGTDPYIQLPSAFNVADRTVTCWIYAIDRNDTMMIFDNRDGSTDGFTFFVDGSNKLRVKIDGTTSDTSVTALDFHRWYHVAVVHDDGATTKIYLDGVEYTSKDTSSVSVDNLSTNARIGSVAVDDNHAYNWEGYICNVGFWTGLLTQPQIKSIMWKQYADLTDSDKDAGTTGSSNLVSWWNLDTDANDSTGTNNGTLS